jgi:hypothetical protein
MVFSQHHKRISTVDHGVIKCVKLNYRDFLMQSLLANMEATPFTTQVAKSISVLDAVIWIAEATKQVSPQMERDIFGKQDF